MKPLPESFLRMLECKPEEFDAVRRSWHRERDAYHSFMQTVDMVCDESKREHQLLSVANNEQFQRMVSERVFEIIRQLLSRTMRPLVGDFSTHSSPLEIVAPWPTK